MTHSMNRPLSRALVLLLALAGAPASAEEDGNSTLGFERTPPRLSFVDGDVSYWRPGDDEWTDARVNTPLALGDELATGAGANLELQTGPRAHVRAGESTQLGLAALEPDYLQLELNQGTVSLDLRDLGSGRTIEIDTPNAAFTIEQPGYYRVEVANDSTTFIARRGGRATVQTEKGLPVPISPNEQVVISGAQAPVLATYGAPAIDDWDRWNYSRSETQAAPVSARYVPEDVYGVEDLDRHGAWRTVPAYGAIWVPRVAVGWTPYSAGRWVNDPYYGHSWVDDAPWGWAPFHYGRWVYVGNYWAWSPGPRVVRAYYSPALVAFYASPSVSISVSFGTPYVGWVALGWGEPIVPWWGPRGCRGNARWAGWGGPRVVNNIRIQNTTYVNASHIKHYQHSGRHGAMVAVERGRFGHGNVRDARVARFDSTKLAPVRGGNLGVRRERGSRANAESRGSRPSHEIRERRLVTRQDPGRARGDARTHTAARATRSGNERPARAAATEAPVRMARAERPPRRTPVTSRASSSREGARDRSVAPAPPTKSARARTDSRDRRSSVSSAPRSGRERTRAQAPQRTHENATGSSRRARATETRAPARPAVDGRSRQRTESRAPRVERKRETRQAPARVEQSPAPRDRRAAPRSERRERSAAPKSDSGGEPRGDRDPRNGGASRSRRS